MYSIPLRRALVTNSDLPYPEGVACAEVLKVGSPRRREGTAEGAEDSRAGLLAVVWGCDRGCRVRGHRRDAHLRERRGTAISASANRGARQRGFDFALSLALFAVGHLVGLWVGIAMLLGALIGWGWGVPHYSSLVGGRRPVAGSHRAGDLERQGALRRRRHDRRRRDLDAGQAGQARRRRPDLGDGRAKRARKAGKLDTLPRTEHDIPIGVVGMIMAGVLRADRLPARAFRQRDAAWARMRLR